MSGPGSALAIHNGSTEDFIVDDRIAFGSRILFEPEVGIGARINDRLIDRGELGPSEPRASVRRAEPGIDNIGARINLKL